MNATFLIDGFEPWHVAGWTMLHFLWLGTLVALVAGVSRIAVRRGGPNAHYALAVGTLLVLALLPIGIAAWLISTSPPRFTLQQDATIAQSMIGDRPDDEIIELAGRELTLPVEVAPATSDIPQKLSETAHSNQHVAEFTPPEIHDQGQTLVRDAEYVPFSSQLIQSLDAWVPYLPWAWLVGAPVTLGVLATGMIGTRRLRRTSRAIVDGPIPDLLARLSVSMRVGKHVSIAVCERIAAPVLIGIVRPIILLPPAALTGWSPDEIEMVLLHELAHVRRWDNAVNLAQRIVESLLFFHPAVWFVSNWIRREREACCDWVVVDRTNRPHAYAELLVALAAQMPRSVLFHPAASSAMAAGPLRKRIRRILQLEDDPMLVSGKSFVIVLAGLLVAGTLAVLYLPSIGQAEESTTQTTESTTELKDSTTENAESSEKHSENEKTEGDSAPIELSADQLQLDTPEGRVVVEADDEPGRVRVRSDHAVPDSTEPAGTEQNQNVFVVYSVSQDLLPRLDQWAELMGVERYAVDKPDRFIMQAREDVHERLRELLDATTGWRTTDATRVRSQDPVVTSEVDGQPRVYWPAMGVTFGAATEVERKDLEPSRVVGVEVVNVAPGSPGAWLTIEPNDTLTRISQFKTTTPTALVSIIENMHQLTRTRHSITFVKHDGEQRETYLSPAVLNRETAPASGQKTTGEKKESDDWLEEVAFASPKDREIARRAWKELGIKFIPLNEAELEAVRRGGFQGGLKVLGLEREMNIQGPLFVTHVQSKRLATGVGDFAALERALDALAAQPADELIVLQGIKTGGGVFQYSMRRPQVEPVSRDPHSDLLVRDIADLRSKKSALESELYRLHAEYQTREARVAQDSTVPPNRNAQLQQLRTEFETATLPLRNQWAVIDESLEKSTQDLADRVQTWIDQEHQAAEAEQRSKFPSLVEQKLADSAYKRLGLELEPISDAELLRVKALGYDGGVKVAFGRQLNPDNGQYGSFEFEDILVGLHVWPTTSLKQVAEILGRDDLAELNPIKFYVARHNLSIQAGGGGYGAVGGYPGPQAQGPHRPADSRDVIVTGRITVRLEPQARIPQPPGTAPTMRMPWDVPDTAPKTSAQPGQPPTTDGLKVYFFHSEDSAPSRDMKAVIERITQVPPGAEFIEFDVNKKPELAKQMNIHRVPTCVFMRDGTELGRIDGAQTEHQLRNAIRAILKTNQLPSAAAATIPPRLFNSNDRTETSSERVVKTFDAETPAEDVKSAIEALTEAGATDGPVQVEVVPHNGKSAIVVRGPTASTRAIASNRANLRYEGKSFDEWRDAWRTELSTEKRLEAVKALAAFGSAGSDAIEQSDILMLNAVKVVPKSPHSIEPFDGLLIRASGLSPGAPIADAFVVDPKGKVDLGPRYGSVSVRGMTIDEARAAIHKHLVKRTSGEDPLDEQIDVSVSLAFAAGAQQIVGEHVVGPDGRINLGTYGSVQVAGKTTDEARRAIEAQLAKYLENPEVVVDTFANHRSTNYAKEAADAIVVVAGQYDWSKQAANESLILLQNACLDAFGGNHGSLPAQLPPNEALSALLRAASSSAAPTREFAAKALRYYAAQNQAALEAIAQLSRDKNADVNHVAWTTLVAVYRPDSPAAFARIHEALAGDQPELQVAALKAVWEHDLTSAPQANNAGIRNVPEIFDLLFSSVPEVCRHARRALQRVALEEVSRIIEQLRKVLEDDSRPDDHVKAIRALAALGLRAKPAVDVLKDILVTDKNSLRIPAAVALKSILGDFEFNKLLGDTIAAELKIDVSESGIVSMRGRPDSQIFYDFTAALEAERKALFP